MSLDSIVNLTAGKISELLVQEATFLSGVKGQVESVQRELTRINAYLKDMEAMGEELGGDDSDRARNMIKEIRGIAYDAEDVIENYIENNLPLANHKSQGFLKRYVACLCSDPIETHKVGADIEAIKERLVEAKDSWRSYLGENGAVIVRDREGLKSRTRPRRPISGLRSHDELVIGFDEDIDNLVEVLTDDDTHIKVVSIVGMGGSGKSTIARKLFDHESVKEHFDCIAMVTVSQQWVAQQVLANLLKKASNGTSKPDDTWSREVLEEMIFRYFEGKQYLVVLDDVWEKEALDYIAEVISLRSGQGKIIITTRHEKVTNLPHIIPITHLHKPRRLDDEESWELFSKIALSSREKNGTTMYDITTLEELGKEMLVKCEGLPLAVIALAGILVEKETVEEWEKVKKAVSSRIIKDGKGSHLYGKVNQMLSLSYSDLPSGIKPCFLYLSLFREDEEIKTRVLIEMWIAEGFITPDMLQQGETFEDVAQQYLDELVCRCLVEVSQENHEGKMKAIRVHDLVRGLCIQKAKEHNFLEVFTTDSEKSDSTTPLASRRTAMYSSDGNYLSFPTKSQGLRSLVYTVDEIKDDRNLDCQLIHKNFRFLRVLVLVSIRTCDGMLPEGIGSLIHLRYLRLWKTNIRELPSSIGNLRNLLTLDYKYVENVQEAVKIPTGLWKIEGLRHLYLPHSYEVAKAMDTGIELDALKKLQTLWGIGGGSYMLKELPRLSASVRKLCITGITSNEQLMAALECPSIGSDCLHSLRLSWDLITEKRDYLTLHSLEPIVHCQHLKKLYFCGIIIKDGFGGVQFPTSITKLDLHFAKFESEATLAALGGLPKLMFLTLATQAYMGNKWTCSAGHFLQLKDLRLYDFTNLEEWTIERGAMPQLRILIISDFEKLSRIPQGLKFLTTLEILYLLDMSDQFYSREKEDAHIIQHVPIVRLAQASTSRV